MAQHATVADRAKCKETDGFVIDEPAHRDLDVEPPSEALMAFVHAMASARYTPPRLPTWWRAHAVRTEDGRCVYCGKDVHKAPVLDPIIPIVAGGPQHPQAVVLCCKGCKGSRGRKDLLTWKPDAHALLKALRIRMALEAWNHVTRDPAAMRTRDKAETALKRRWSRPRFCCHAAMVEEGGFIGWRDVAQVPSHIPLRLFFEHQAGRFQSMIKPSHRRHVDRAIFWIPTRAAALDAIWDMIEHNALVRPVHLNAPSPNVERATDPSHDWTLVLPTTADLVRRRWRQP